MHSGCGWRLHLLLLWTHFFFSWHGNQSQVTSNDSPLGEVYVSPPHGSSVVSVFMSLTTSDLSGQPLSSGNPQAERDADKIRMVKCKNCWNSQKHCCQKLEIFYTCWSWYYLNVEKITIFPILLQSYYIHTKWIQNRMKCKCVKGILPKYRRSSISTVSINTDF